MGRVRTIARRSFLIGSAAIVGGVAFGVWRARTPFPNPLADAVAEGQATFNPWVVIDADKVTLVTSHADKGQGVTSIQAALIAEELDIEFGQFETVFGGPDRAYYNTALANDMAPFWSSDESLTAETVRGLMGGIAKIAMPIRGTGGSSSVPDSFVKLREAGAVARETLKLAASQQTGIPIAELKTAQGAVILPDGTRIAYTALAGVAAGLDPVLDVTLRDPSEWRLLGKPMQRLDIVAKSTGTQAYGIDFEAEGMLHAAIRRNPRRGGAVTGFDATAARALRGVRDVFEVTGGIAVIADNTWRAIRAANAVQVDWGPAPYPAEQAAHWEAIAAAFTDDALDKEWRADGDVDAALAASDPVVAEYRSPYVAHQPLEPLNATVLVTDDAVDVWAGHQMMSFVPDAIAAVTGHDAAQVRFHNQYIGGSFGHRLELGFLVEAAEIANRMRGTPVKLTYSREEDFARDFARAPAIARARGTVRDGRVDAMDLQIAGPSVLASQMGRVGFPAMGPDNQLAAGAWNNPYALPNMRLRAYRAPELAPVSSWRSVGAAANGFFFDSFLDELIHAAGADPMAERIRLMAHEPARKVLEAVAEMSSWGAPLAPGQGHGVAFVESFGVPVAEVVEVTSTDAGVRLDRVWIAADVGTVLDPVNFENIVQGGVIFGLGHAMNSEITYADGMAQQVNFWDAEGLRHHQCPEIIVRGLGNGNRVRGIGEPPVPPTAPALANAIFAATGTRLREMPFNRKVTFV